MPGWCHSSLPTANGSCSKTSNTAWLKWPQSSIDIRARVSNTAPREKLMIAAPFGISCITSRSISLLVCMVRGNRLTRISELATSCFRPPLPQRIVTPGSCFSLRLQPTSLLIERQLANKGNWSRHIYCFQISSGLSFNTFLSRLGFSAGVAFGFT